jgi:addiction module HigA family antidote
MRIPIHPGEILADELESRELSASQLAQALHVPANRITQIIKRQRGITADTALRLGRFFGTSAEFWSNLQMMYELDLAVKDSGKDIESIKPLEMVA